MHKTRHIKRKNKLLYHFFFFFVWILKRINYICQQKLKTIIYFIILQSKIMNKKELIDKIAAAASISKADAKKALEAATDAMKEALVAGDKVQLIGFGTFSVSERPERQGINPATKEPITIAAKKVVKFKAGAELADAIV